MNTLQTSDDPISSIQIPYSSLSIGVVESRQGLLTSEVQAFLQKPSSIIIILIFVNRTLRGIKSSRLIGLVLHAVTFLQGALQPWRRLVPSRYLSVFWDERRLGIRLRRARGLMGRKKEK